MTPLLGAGSSGRNATCTSDCPANAYLYVMYCALPRIGWLMTTR
jgi:hypothetical protein